MEKKNIADIYRLSAVQEGLLFHTLEAPESGMYLQQFVRAINDIYIDIATVKIVWDMVLKHHPILRTSFHWENIDRAFQIVSRKAEVSVDYHDLRKLPEAEQTVAIDTYLEQDLVKPFNLSKAPLMRVTLLRTNTELLHVWTYHHLLLDGWSCYLVLEDLIACLNALRAGKTPSLRTPPPFREYISWFYDQDLKPVEAYWRKKLVGFDTPTSLKVAGAAIDTQELNNRRETFVEYSVEEMQMFKAFLRQHRLTLNTLVHAAWALVLSAYSGEKDVVFGSVVSGRPIEIDDIDTMVGVFINTLPIRVKFSARDTVLHWLEQLQEQLVEMRSHEHSPLFKVQQWSDIPKGNRLFESFVTLENFPLSENIEKVFGRLRDNHVIQRNNYALTLQVEPGDKLSIRIIWDTNRFDAATIDRMLEYYGIVLHSLITMSDRHLCELPVLTPGEQEYLLNLRNDTAREYPEKSNIHEMFEACVKNSPNILALLSGERRVSYHELNQQSNRLAHLLQTLGVEPEVIVAICIERSIDMMVGILGVLKAGGAYVPLDPKYPSKRLDFLLEDTKAPVVLTQVALKHLFDNSQTTVICLDEKTQYKSHSAKNPTYYGHPDNLAYVIYTSGSTGTPKGVQVSHRTLVNYIQAMQERMSIAQSMQWAPLGTVAADAAHTALFGSLCLGGTLRIIDEQCSLDADALAQEFEREAVDVLKVTPTHLSALLMANQAHQILPKQYLILGGERVEPTLVERILALAPDCRILNSYGPTETTVAISVAELNRTAGFGEGRHDSNLMPAIGTPLANSKVYVLDQWMYPVPMGVPGELYIGGLSLSRGYLNNTGQTADKFIPDPYSVQPGARMYRSGDRVCCRQDGDLEYLGRIDQQVKIRGFRIELGEIQAVLMSDSGVEDVAVVVREDAANEPQLVAYLVAKPGQSLPDTAQLQENLKAVLPEYMIPGFFVPIASLPLTINGKLDLEALPAPDGVVDLGNEYVAPRTDTENNLVEIWSSLLNVEKIGVHDNFFELGGHSLLVTQLVSRIRAAFEVELRLPQLFDAPTVAAMAALVDSSSTGLVAPAITPAPRNDALPLSFAQQRLWFLNCLDPDSATYNIPSAVRVRGELDEVGLSVLTDAFNSLVARHETLRTTFTSVEGVGMQVVHPELKLNIPIVDLRLLTAEQANAEVRRVANDDALTPFDLSTGPLIRMHLLRISNVESVMLLNVHHIIADGWSMIIFVNELNAFVEAHRNGSKPVLAELPVQYADFAVWQRDWFQGEVLDQQLKYWVSRLKDIPPALELPTDRPRPAVLGSEGALYSFDFPQQLVQGLQVLTARSETTPFMVLLAGFQALLQRYSGQDDFAIGSTIANRNREEIEGVIGFFVNTLVLRTDLLDNPTVDELLARVKQTTLGAYAHQDLPFERLVEELQPPRDGNRTPLFQVMFTFQESPTKFLEEAALDVSIMEMDLPLVKFDITLRVDSLENGFECWFEYNTNLFDVETIHRLADHFIRLLQGMVDDPKQYVNSIPLLSKQEQDQLVRQWNGGDAVYPVQDCIHAVFEARAQEDPDAIALVCGQKTLSYSELNQRANRVAHHLRSTGVCPDMLVGVCLQRSLNLVVGLLAVLKAGGAYVPLDPSIPRDRLTFILDDASVNVLLTESSLVAQLPQQAAQLVCVDDTPLFSEYSDVNPSHINVPGDLAYVIYTSGSTGIPKGVLNTHYNVTRLFESTKDWYRFSNTDVWTLFHSFAFDFSVWEIWGALFYGGRLVVVPQMVARSPSAYYQLLCDQQVTVLNQTPSAFYNLIKADEEVESSSVKREGLNLRYVIFGGEALDLQQLRPWFERHGDHQPQLVNMYGITETTVHTTYRPISSQDLDNDLGSVIGKALPDLALYILDSMGNPVPIGVNGELYVGGAGLARGYLNRNTLTTERFVPNPFSNSHGTRLYRSGDLARYLPNGEIEYLGRIDQQVKLRGFRIELGEIESALLNNPVIGAAVVQLREDIPGDKRLVAYLVADKKQTMPDVSTLRTHLKTKLPDYMIPSAFVTLDALPITSNGKLDRKALPMPEGDVNLANTYMAPRSEAELQLAEIWRALLRTERVGVHDNFFELGGDSILSIQVVARANQAGLQLSPKQMFDHQTIAELAQVAGTGQQVQAEQGLVSGAAVLTPIQRWFFEQSLQEAHHFNQSMLFAVPADIDAQLVSQSVDKLIEHHDALRLRYRNGSQRDVTGWHQDYHATDALAEFEVVDLSAYPKAEHTTQLETRCTAYQSSLSLEEGPLFRVVLFTLGPDEPRRLLWTIHHLAVDGVSWRILLEDFNIAYEQQRQGQAVSLPPKTTSFKQWGQRLQGYSQSDELLNERAYWQRTAAAHRALPLDRSGDIAANTYGNAEEIKVVLDAQITEALLKEIPAVYNTQINDILLTALVLTLQDWSHTSSVSIDMEGHGRVDLFDDVDVSRTVGWFTTLFPVGLHLNAGVELGEAIKSVKEQLRAIPRQGIGYGLLRYLREDDSTVDIQVQPQISFNYLGQLDVTQLDAASSGPNLFSAAEESAGRSRSPVAQRSHLLDINAVVSSGQLQLSWGYCPQFHNPKTITYVANTFIEKLKQLLYHCQRPEAGGVTPSDFPLARLTQGQLDKLMQRIAAQGPETAPVVDLYLLSPMQSGLLFHALYSPQSESYFEQLSCSVHGSVDLEVFKQAWQDVLDQHTILRSSFHWEHIDAPLQAVHAHAQLAWTELDWRYLSEQEQVRRLTTFLQADRAKGFDLQHAPLMRCALIQRSEDHYTFVWSHHHILLDGWCLPMVFEQVFAAISARQSDQCPQLPKTRPYRDYIEWIDRQDAAAAEAFWHEHLSGFTAPTPLLEDKSPGTRLDGNTPPAEHWLTLTLEKSQALTAFARHHQLTLNTVIQGVWALLLSRYSGENDVVFGTTVSGRSPEIAGVESMLGIFINTLAVRVQVSEYQVMTDWLSELQAQLVELRQYEYSSLAQVQGWSEVPSEVPLFESLVIFENYPMDSNAMKGTDRGMDIDDVQFVEHTNYPLALIAIPGTQLKLKFQYAPDRFDAEVIDKLLTHFERLLDGMLARPEGQLSSMSMLTESECQQILVDWNKTNVLYPKDQLIHRLFEQQVIKTPETVAVAFNDESLTYLELNHRANQVAHYLVVQGIGPDALVGICIEHSLELVVGIIGVLKAGGAYVPLDPGYPDERIEFMLSDAAPQVLLTQHELKSGLHARLTDIGLSASLVALDEANEEIDNQANENLPDSELGLIPSNLAYVIYTSGSTGRPKGVTIPHGGLMNYLSWCLNAYAPEAGQGTLLYSSLAFDFTITSLFTSLLTGKTIHISKENDLDSLSDIFSKTTDLSLLKLTPAHLVGLSQNLPENGFSHLTRKLIVGGEALHAYHLKNWLLAAPNCTIINEYGPTEAVVGCANYVFNDLRGLPGEIPIGKPIQNMQLYVLDQYFNPTPIGVPGELYIGGVGLARGYLNAPALSAERFIPNPFSDSPGARLYKTGDKARYQYDGNLEFLGRFDDQVKLRGFRIELGEIESALVKHPAISVAAVHLREDSPGEKRLVAYLVANGEASIPDVSTLRAYLNTLLPDYMIPSAFVTLVALPMTSNGKLDRKALPMPEGDVNLANDYMAPRNDVELQLADIWRALLRTEKVGIHDNFFELGGDSILSIQVVARANQAGLHLSPKQIFDHQTVAQLADVAGKGQQVQAEQGQVTGPANLTPIQHWFFEQSLQDAHHFNQTQLFEVPADIDTQWVAQSVDKLMEHHDALRLRYHYDSGEWYQDHRDAEELAVFDVVDLSSYSRAQQSQQIEAQCAAYQASLSLEEGRLFKVMLFTLGPNEPGRLLWAIHHLAIDGVSWRILLEDFNIAYEQQRQGQVVSLSPKTTSFKQWGQRLQDYSQSDDLLNEMDYWQQTAAANLVLPFDRSGDREANTYNNADEIKVVLDTETTRALQKEVPAVYNTQINDILLTALVLALQDWCHDSSVCIDLEGHGRVDLFDDIDLSRTVGWFTTIFPVGLHLDTGTGPGDAIKSVKEQLRAIPQQGIGYGLLRYLRGEDSAVDINVQPQISFNYLGQLDVKQLDDTSNGPNLLSVAQESAGRARSPLALRRHLLDINGAISAGQLQLSWSYCAEFHDRDTIKSVADGFIFRLKELVHHCQLPEAGGVTPSDFPLASLSQNQLDKLLQRIEAQGPETAPVVDLYPLSPMQSGLLFHALYAPQSETYFEQLSCSVHGTVDVVIFKQAWQDVLNNHTILRSSFHWEHIDAPLQAVHAHAQLEWIEQDWRNISEQEQVRRLQAFLDADRAKGFDLQRAPLMRCALIQRRTDHYTFVWSHHHLLLDGWCLPMVLEQVFAAISARQSQQTPALNRARPYRDYIEWIQRQDAKAAESFWGEYLTGFSAPTPLLGDKSPATRVDGKTVPEDHFLTLTNEKSEALSLFARSHQLTLNTVIQGAWALMLSRYSGENDVLFGATVSGRSPEISGVESMLGIFINTLAVRVQVPPNKPVLEWLSELQAQQVDLRQYEYSSLAQVQGWSEVPSEVPLFESLVIFENYPMDSTVMNGANMGLDIADVQFVEHTNYPLALIALPGAQLKLKIQYAPDRFEAEVIDRLLSHLAHLLDGMLARPQGLLGALSILTDSERQQLLVDWNETAALYPKDQSIHSLFEQQVIKSPDSIAVVFNDESFTYAKLNQQANRLAHHLHSIGVGPDVLVCVCLSRSIDMVVALLAVLKAGGAYVPLDPDYPKERLAFVLEDTQALVLLTQESLLPKLSESSAVIICLDNVSNFQGYSTKNPAKKLCSDNLCYVIYTSGSTGRPKGVGVQHFNAVNFLVSEQQYLGFTRDEILLAVSSLSFDITLMEIFLPLLNGAQVVIADKADTTDPHRLAKLIEERLVTIMQATPSTWRLLVDSQWQPKEPITTISGGEPLSGYLATQLLQRGCKLGNLYGPTETTVWSTGAWVTRSMAEQPFIAIGKPITNTQVYILDDQLNPVPTHVTGEIYIAGDGLARGYLSRPLLTAEKFIPNPFSENPGARMYRSGDAGRYLPNGDIEFSNRIDFQVKIRGFRIELGEIEAMLNQLTYVNSTVVMAREDEPGDKRLVAYLVGDDAATIPDVSTIRAHLKAMLPDYMIPSAFVILDAFPITSNGKLDRKALPKPGGDSTLTNVYVAPRTETEQQLAEIWRRLLNLERVSVYDDFFALGGHSLLATQAVSRVRDRFAAELSLSQFFVAPTIAEQAEVLDGMATGEEINPITVVSRDGALPLSYAQQRLWFLDRLQPDSAVYNIPAAVRLKGPLDSSLMEQAFNTLMMRHETLRTSFDCIDGEAVQVIHSESNLILALEDLSALAIGDAEARALQIAHDEAHRPFDLVCGPLIRARLLTLGEQDHLLVLNMHHIISDGWSMGVLVTELSTIYETILNGTALQLPELPVQYADFAAWQRGWLQGEALERQRSYWTEQLAELPPVLSLHTDLPRPAVQTYNGARYRFSLPETLNQSLR